MPIIAINTPTLATDVAQIATFISTIEAGAPTTLDSFFAPCWALKPSGDCEALILTDFTDYTSLVDGSPIPPEDLVISSTFGPLSACGCEIVTNSCSTQTLLPGSITSYDSLTQDGVFCAEITITYTDSNDEGDAAVYTKTLKVSYETDCCERKYRELSYNIWGKMSDISCTINKLSKIGRNIKGLKKSYLQLSNLLWLYYNSVDSCNERDKVFCIYNKIK
jgi:hypothetical protein